MLSLIWHDQTNLAELPTHGGVDDSGLSRGIVADTNNQLSDFFKASRLTNSPLAQKIPITNDLLIKFVIMEFRK